MKKLIFSLMIFFVFPDSSIYAQILCQPKKSFLGGISAGQHLAYSLVDGFHNAKNDNIDLSMFEFVLSFKKYHFGASFMFAEYRHPTFSENSQIEELFPSIVDFNLKMGYSYSPKYVFFVTIKNIYSEFNTRANTIAPIFDHLDEEGVKVYINKPFSHPLKIEKTGTLYGIGSEYKHPVKSTWLYGVACLSTSFGRLATTTKDDFDPEMPSDYLAWDYFSSSRYETITKIVCMNIASDVGIAIHLGKGFNFGFYYRLDYYIQLKETASDPRKSMHGFYAHITAGK
ncbi:hypothetical protein A2V82_03900 [candidate division KSB1 bacterium RBG_16_48_16]|nr:MAG: hypothetical protein A2V82_03900 [candidate division KSB1 bacterium RBG_16_48_16]